MPEQRRYSLGPHPGSSCVYCENPADGSVRDTYGEWVLGRPLVVCAECNEDFEHEDGPWRP